jgi:26S proteasome non-ATPase regulatory subunit 10
MPWAAASGYSKMIHIFLYHKESTTTQDTEDYSPLHLTCDKDRLEEQSFWCPKEQVFIYIKN